MSATRGHSTKSSLQCGHFLIELDSEIIVAVQGQFRPLMNNLKKKKFRVVDDYLPVPDACTTVCKVWHASALDRRWSNNPDLGKIKDCR